MEANAIMRIVKLAFKGIMFNKLISNISLKAFCLVLIDLVNTSVIKLAKTLPDKLVRMERIKLIKEIINPNLKFFQSDLIKRLIVPFLGLACSLTLGMINYLLSVFETDRLLDKSRYSLRGFHDYQWR